MVLTIGLFLPLTHVKAGTIEKGIISLCGSSNIFFRSRNFDNYGEDRDIFDISIKGGYFAINNLEVGVKFSLYRQDEDDMDISSYGFAPSVTYHYPLDSNANIYIGTSIGFTKYDKKYSSGSEYDEDSIIWPAIEIGWEYFLNPHTAIDLGLNLQQVEWELSGYSFEDDTETRFTSEVGLKVFF